jgi:hypothetical protein
MVVELNKWLAAICVSVVVVLVQVIVAQGVWIAHLHSKTDLLLTGQDIARDQIQDLSQQLEAARSTSQTVGVQQFVAGVNAATQNPGYYSEVWHDGYNRGTTVQQYVYEQEQRETEYTTKQADEPTER